MTNDGNLALLALGVELGDAELGVSADEGVDSAVEALVGGAGVDVRQAVEGGRIVPTKGMVKFGEQNETDGSGAALVQSIVDIRRRDVASTGREGIFEQAIGGQGSGRGTDERCGSAHGRQCTYAGAGGCLLIECLIVWCFLQCLRR